jgi:hypothetical protein
LGATGRLSDVLIVLAVLLGWCLVALVVGLALGRFAVGPPHDATDDLGWSVGWDELVDAN